MVMVPFAFFMHMGLACDKIPPIFFLIFAKFSGFVVLKSFAVSSILGNKFDRAFLVRFFTVFYRENL